MSEERDFSRRDAIKFGTAAAATAVTLTGAPAIVHAAPDQVRYGIIGVGGRGQYLMHHLSRVDNGKCIAVCDVDEDHANLGIQALGGPQKPKYYKDYRSLLADKDVEAVIIAVHLSAHYPVTKDTLQANTPSAKRPWSSVRKKSARFGRSRKSTRTRCCRWACSGAIASSIKWPNPSWIKASWATSPISTRSGIAIPVGS